MRRFASPLFFVVGLALCLLAAGVLFSRMTYTYAQAEEAEYIGTRDCADCHRSVVRDHNASPHALTLQNVERDEEKILADFSQGEELRLVQFPGNDEPRAFAADDIAFAVGSGRYVQRYLFEVERGDYRVFPAEWNVQTQAWQPFTLAESWDDPAYNWVQNCAYCHTTGLNIRRGRWEDEGVQCEACHGPGSVHAELAGDLEDDSPPEDLAAARAAIYLGVDPQTCGQCHSQGSSPDNQYPYPAAYLPGMTLLDTAVLTLVPRDDPTHWWLTGHASQPNMQYNEWVNSTHAVTLENLKASPDARPECLTCHSADYLFNERLRTRVASGERAGTPPDALTVETARWGVTCATCHNPHLENTDHNNFLVAARYELCVNCHTDRDASDGLHHAMQQIYEGATLIENIPGIASSHFTTEDGPDCITCHMPAVPVESATRASHTQQPILPGAVINQAVLEDSCMSCHAEQVTAEQMQQLIDDIQNDTRARLERARGVVTGAAPAWVTLALDLVEGDGSLGIHNYAYTDELLDAVEVELGLTALTEGQ